MDASAPRADASSDMWFRTGSPLGLLLVDLDEQTIGRIDGTWPLDGSGEPEFAIVRTRRFGQSRLVPLGAARIVDGLLQVPYTRLEIDDAPNLEIGRYLLEQVDRARAYYVQEIETSISR